MYNNTFDELNQKWNKIISRYRKLFNPKLVSESYLAIEFIQKYFTPDIRVGHAILNRQKLAPNPIAQYFTDTYIPYEKFFGEDYASKFISSLTRIDSSIYEFSNGRITNPNLTLKSIGGTSHNYRFSSSNILYPKLHLTTLPRKAVRGSYGNAQNQLLVNDSGNKQAWKKKAKLFMEKNPRDRYLLVDPKDKLELMMIKRVSKDAPNIIYYSDFAKEIVPAPKSAPNTRLSFYNGNSFTKGIKKIMPQSYNIEEFDLENSLFMEYTLTTSTFYTNGTAYPNDKFARGTWEKLLHEFHNKDLILMNKTNLKKLREARPELTMFEDFINTPEFIEGFEDIHMRFLFVPDIREIKVGLGRAITFIIEHVIDKIYRNYGVQERNFINYWYLIINSTSPELKALFGRLSTIYETVPESTKASLYHIGRNILEENIIYTFGWDPNSLNYLLQKKLPIDPKEDLVNSAMAGFSHLKDVKSLSDWNSCVFGFDDLILDYNNLLEESKYLNLNIEEITAEVSALMEYYLKRWDLKVRLLNKVTSVQSRSTS